MDITIRQAQAQVDEWIKTVGVRYFNELTNLGILVEETGELARIMVRRYGEQSFPLKSKVSIAPKDTRPWEIIIITRILRLLTWTW